MPPETGHSESPDARHAYQHRLTAVLSVDVQDYSRLMEQDESRTVDTIKQYRKILATIITRNRGRVVDATGDNLLAAFPSAMDAVSSALLAQDEIEHIHQSIPEEKKMLLRIGIHLADVIVDGDRIYGDGVNIASRLESLAPGGGICISGNVYDQVRNKINLGCTYLGLQTVKNISKPIRVYEIHADGSDGQCKTRIPSSRKRLSRKRITAVVIGLVLLTVAIPAIQKLIFPPAPSPIPPSLIGSGNALHMNRATVAVLPFTSLNPEGSRSYLADGITNDIITDLSKFSALSVSASNTVYRFKGKPVDVSEIGRQLDAAYILEGTVQSEGKQVRINAQLIDTATGKHLWASRYTRDITEILTLQNTIVETIVRKLSLNIDQIERQRALAKKTKDLSAYDNYLRGLHHLYRRSREGMVAAKKAFKKAIETDPRFGSAYIGLAEVRILDAAYGYTEFPSEAMQEAEVLLKKALSADAGNTEAMVKLAYVYMRRGAYDLATSEAEKALEINPNDWRLYRVMAPVLLYSGKPDIALKWYQESLKYDPYVTPGLYMNIGICHYLEGRHDQAIEWLVKGSAKWPTFLGHHIVLASLYGHTNDLHNAKLEVSQIRKISPFFEIKFYGKAFRNPKHREIIVNGLRKAGMN